MSNNWRTLICLACLLFGSIADAARADVQWRYPSPAGSWGPEQYTHFEHVYFHSHLALPYLRTTESRAVFDRLVDRNNIDRIIAESASREDRRRKLAIIWSALGAIRADYNESVFSGEPLQEELTRVQVFNLYVAGAIVALAETDVTTINGGSAIKTQYLGVVHSLGERHVYSGTQIATLSDALARRFPELDRLFNDTERARLRDQVASLARQAADVETRMALDRLLATISVE